MKRILLTGAFGTLGEAIREVGQDQYEFVCVDRIVPEGNPQAPLDVTDKKAVIAAAEGCDAIIHTAFFRTPWKPLKEAEANERFYHVNTIGTDNIFQAARVHQIPRVVVSSSMEVTIGTSWGAGGLGVIDEQSPPRLDSLYNLNKRLMETVASFYYQTAGITGCCLRYMEFSRNNRMKLGYALLARSLWRNDVARANLLAVESDRITCEPINIGPQTPLTNADVLESFTDYDGVVEKHFPGATKLLEEAGRHYGRAALWPVAKIDRARALLGWEPQWTFQTLLEALRAEAEAPAPVASRD